MWLLPIRDSQQRTSGAAAPKRRGTATVELALLAPIIFLFIFALIEFGRAFMVLELLSNAARSGCRLGVLEGTSTADINAAVNDTLAKSRISGATVTVLVNGAEEDARTATNGDEITVTVAVPSERVSWLPGGGFLSGMTLSDSVVMRRE